MEFDEYLRKKMKLLGMDEKFINRPMNAWISPVERKSAMKFYRWRFWIRGWLFLDETDSGLDIDSMRIVADGVNKLRSKDNSILVITHYQRLLNYIIPDFVHILYDGKIIKSRGKELAFEVEEKGYDWLVK